MAAVAFAVTGVGFTNKLYVGEVVGRIPSLIASHISKILDDNWRWMIHIPQFRPSRVGIFNLLISMLKNLDKVVFFLFVVQKGLIPDAQRDVCKVFTWLVAQRGLYYEMPDARRRYNNEVVMILGRW